MLLFSGHQLIFHQAMMKNYNGGLIFYLMIFIALQLDFPPNIYFKLLLN